MKPDSTAAPLLLVSFVKPNAILIAKIIGRLSKIAPPALATNETSSRSGEPKRNSIAAAGKTATGNINVLPML